MLLGNPIVVLMERSIAAREEQLGREQRALDSPVRHKAIRGDECRDIMACAYVIEPGICRRILGEYEDLPGLRLSVRQAARLWSLELAYCEATLEFLVAEGLLRRSAQNEYCASPDSERRLPACRVVHGSAA